MGQAPTYAPTLVRGSSWLFAVRGATDIWFPLYLGATPSDTGESFHRVVVVGNSGHMAGVSAL